MRILQSCRPARRVAPALLTALIVSCALVAPAAQAGSLITKLAAGPIAASTHCNPNLTPEQFVTTAGGRTDYCMAYYLDSGDPERGDDIRQTVVDNPQGFLATSDSSPQCSLADYAPASSAPSRCPANTQTGAGQALVRVSVGGLIVPQTVPVKMWNLEHAQDSVAGVGIELAPNLGGIDLPRTKIVGYVTLRPNPDVGLRTTISGMPRTTDIGGFKAPIALDGFFLRFWGSKLDHPTLERSFALLGSDCRTDQVTRITAVSYGGIRDEAEDRYRLTDCERVPFGVDAQVRTTERRPDVPTGVSVTVGLEQNFEPRVSSNLSATTLTLPAGLELGAQIASGEPLELCTPEQFGWADGRPVECPQASRVADVEIVSPLQANPFRGSGYLGSQPRPGALPQLFIVGQFSSAPDAMRVKLRAQLEVDAAGRITTTLTDLPQVTFERFTLTFRGGDHAPLQTPRACGTTVGELIATPSNGNGPVSRALPITIDEDCVDPAAFTPSMAISTSNAQAGGRGVMRVVVSRPDRQARFSRLLMNLPQGILADLRLATECAKADAEAGTCPASSRVGTMTAESGVGPAPYAVRGEVFLRERDEGAVAGLVIAAPVRFGPVDLGMLHLPARIELRPGDLGLQLTTEVPQRFKGLPLSLRSFAVDLDREGFSVNPTSCNELTSTSTFTADTGTSAAVGASLRLTGCERLGFSPAISLRLSGQMGANQKPGIEVTLQRPAGDANLRDTTVLLPDGLAADLKQVPRACSAGDWAAGACPATSRIGTVEGRLTITDEVLSGTLHMVKITGQVLPGIGIQFQGRFASRLLGSIAVDRSTGRLATTFANLPDVPITSLKMRIDGGPSGALFSTAALCGSTPTMSASFVGQSGARLERTVTAPCSGVQRDGAGLATVTGSLRAGLVLRLVAPTGQRIRVARMTLPQGVRISPARWSSSGRLRGAAGVRLVGRTLALPVPAGGAPTVTVRLPKGALVVSRGARRAGRVTVSVRLAYDDGRREVVRIRLRA